jgi:hypothetical protein
MSEADAGSSAERCKGGEEQERRERRAVGFQEQELEQELERRGGRISQ